MKHRYASHIAVAALISLLPICAHPAEAERSKTAPASPAASAEDLAMASERIRQTGAQIRDDIKKARARLEAQEAERKREAERARQQAIKDAAVQAAIKEQKQRQALEAAQAQARLETAQKTEHDRQLALAAQRTKDEQAARERAATALMEARKSAGPKAFADESPKEKAARALREARKSAAPKAFADENL